MSENQLEFFADNSQMTKIQINHGQNHITDDVRLDIELEERFRRSENDGSNVNAKEFINGLLEDGDDN